MEDLHNEKIGILAFCKSTPQKKNKTVKSQRLIFFVIEFSINIAYFLIDYNNYGPRRRPYKAISPIFLYFLHSSLSRTGIYGA